MEPRSSPRRPAAARTFLALLAGVASCGSEPAPTWLHLLGTEVHYPAERSTLRALWGPGEALLVHDQGRSELEIPLRREQWQRDEDHGLWLAPLTLHLPTEKEHLRLVTAEGMLPRRPVAALGAEGARGFNFRKDAVVLGGFGASPPESATLVCTVEAPPPGNEPFRHPAFAGRGLEMVPGLRVSCTIDLPAGSALRFGTSFEPLLEGLSNPDGVVFRIRLDGEILFEHRAAPVAAGCEWHEAPLPIRGVEAARLDFELDGGIVHGAFFDPTIGPARVGEPGRRPWEDPRPDVVVFLADTFRADNLTACGGEARVTPNLDALADGGLCFVQARSTAAWTLPAHASLFSGHYPPQVLDRESSELLAEGFDTIAERLARAGYRTGAVTDGGFVSSVFGFAQGFAYFTELSENQKDLPGLLEEAREFLEADDGRPTFLFVQTYHVHWPYQVSARARAELPERLGIRGEAGELLERVVREAHALGAAEIDDVSEMESLPSSPEMTRLAAELRAHYLGGVSDLDHELGAFLAYLRARGLFDTGYLVFTSDHGEGFGEHGALFHSSDPFEEQVRIPLLLVGRGLEGARIDTPVSLVDLAPTLAGMAGIAADPSWPGRSLLAENRTPRTLFGFESYSAPADAAFVLEGQRKLLLTQEQPGGSLIGAYDLGEDAAEIRDQAAGAAWPGELLERSAATLAAILVPLAESTLGGEAIELDATKAAELDALGY